MDKQLLALYILCGESLLQRGDLRQATDLLLAGVYLAAHLGEADLLKRCQQNLLRIEKNHAAAHPEFAQNTELRLRAEQMRQEYPLERMQTLQQSLEATEKKPPSRLQKGLASLFGGAPRSEPSRVSSAKGFEELKRLIHARLVEKLDLSRVSDLSAEVLRREIRLVIERLCDTENPLLNRMERERLIDEVLDETFGFGPLEVLLKDPTITALLILGPDKLYATRRGRVERVDTTFRDAEHLRQTIDRIFSSGGRRLDPARLLQKTRLHDGSTVSLLLPPLAVAGPILRIDRPTGSVPRLEDLLNEKTLTPEMAMLLEGSVKARLNVVVSGQAQSGKTTLLNQLARFVPEDATLLIIESSAELQLDQERVLRLSPTVATGEGKSEVTIRDLLRQAGAWRPDQIILDDCAGPEAWEVLRVMKTVCPVLTSVHAQDPADALIQLETLALMGSKDLVESVVRRQMASTVDLVVQVSQLRGGPRRVTSISEVTGLGHQDVALREIFRFRQTELDAQGRARGQFEATGVQPSFLSRLEAAGVRLPSGLFQERVLMRD